MRHRIFPSRYSTDYSSSPAAPWLDAFAAWHAAQGYGVATLRSHLRVARRVLEVHGSLALDTRFSDTDLKHLFATTVRPKQFADARWAFARFLRSRDQWIDTPLRHRHSALIDAYEKYLQEIRGLAPATIDQQLRFVRDFLNAHCRASRGVQDLTIRDVEQFIAVKAKRVSRRCLGSAVCALRSFLRYAHQRGLLGARLDEIDMPRRFRDERPPRAVPWDLAQKLLMSIDRRTRMGSRDHAILYLMTHFGLRTGESTQLTLKDIDLDRRLLHVPQSKTRQVLSLPLSAEALRILRRYLQFGRPRTAHPQVFLSVSAPLEPMMRGAIAEIFRRRVKDAGLPLAGHSPYGLRHGFAMRLLERGVGIKAIGDLLGHRTLESTGVYLRLNTEALREVALPVPRSNAAQAVGGAS
ncbi:MAG: tyrosine-type recombinase/integrase [Burkholderiaceae bacterium]